jgi:hypothetical protein
MDNNIVKKELKSLKKEDKLLNFVRNINQYNFIQCDYKKLKPFTYTIVLKNTKVITNIKCKGTDSFINLKRGDYVLCGPQNEKYGLPLEKVLDTYDLNEIQNKKLVRKGYKLTKKNTKNKTNVNIIASWGSEQKLKVGDYIMLENDNKNYYGIDKNAFKKTYKLSKKN